MTDHGTTSERFFGGVSYYPDHWPETDWETDLRRIQDAGLTLVRFGEFSWSWFEPRRGEFDFAAYDRFMDLADRLGMAIQLCTPTASAPPWLLHKWPDALMVDNNGDPHPGGRRMVCYNQPDARAVAENSVRTLATHFRGHPALHSWQIDNEPGVGGPAKLDAMCDYNPHTTRKFQGYLATKFGDIQTLNERWVNNFWSRAYSCWEEIEAPRRPIIPGLWLEWLRFRQADMAEVIHWQRDLLREVCPDTPIGINIPVCGPFGGALGGRDYWLLSEGLDIIGTDIYVFQRDAAQEDRVTAMVSDLIRCVARDVGAEFWISETQAGPHRLPWRMAFAGGWWGPDFLRRCTTVSAAHGAKAVIYFLWRPVRGGKEFGWNGMVDVAGMPTEISAAVPSILEDARRTPSLIGNRPVATIHYANDSFMLASGFDPDRSSTGSVAGWHFMLEDLGYQIDYVDDHGLANRRWTDQDVLVLPYSFLLSAAAAESLRQAAEAGAVIIAGFGTAFFDDAGSLHLLSPGHELDALLGIRIKGFDCVPAKQAPTVAGHPDLILDGMTSLIDLLHGEVTAWKSTGLPLITSHGQSAYVAFDIGSLYLKGDLDKRTQLCRLWQRAVPIAAGTIARPSAAGTESAPSPEPDL